MQVVISIFINYNENQLFSYFFLKKILTGTPVRSKFALN